jgi:predicted small secreted protein
MARIKSGEEDRPVTINAGRDPASEEYMMKRILLALLAIAILSIAVTGCRTAHGLGEDIENTGQKLQDKTEN